MSRKSCWDCVRKHIAQASVLMDEAKLGYPFHRWYAVGNLAEAESESRGEFLDFSQKIRKVRLLIMNDEGEPDFDSLIMEACVLAGNEKDVKLDEHNSKKFDKQP